MPLSKWNSIEHEIKIDGPSKPASALMRLTTHVSVCALANDYTLPEAAFHRSLEDFQEWFDDHDLISENESTFAYKHVTLMSGGGNIAGVAVTNVKNIYIGVVDYKLQDNTEIQLYTDERVGGYDPSEREQSYPKWNYRRDRWNMSHEFYQTYAHNNPFHKSLQAMYDAANEYFDVYDLTISNVKKRVPKMREEGIRLYFYRFVLQLKIKVVVKADGEDRKYFDDEELAMKALRKFQRKMGITMYEDAPDYLTDVQEWIESPTEYRDPAKITKVDRYEHSLLVTRKEGLRFLLDVRTEAQEANEKQIRMIRESIQLCHDAYKKKALELQEKRRLRGN